MNRKAMIADVIQQCRLSINLDEAERIFETIAPSLERLDIVQKNAILLMLERDVLNEQGGHRLSMSLGQSDAANNPDCLVCQRPVTASDWSVRINSAWENTQIWLTWHSYCLENAEVEQEFDLLTGDASTPLGFK
jgi:hypothetical protein